MASGEFGSRELRVASCEWGSSILEARNSLLDTRNSKLPSGLTLIELLITIAIIATLATMFLGASNAAMESSRAARTKSTIGKLHTLLMERWESYSTRRVDIQQGHLAAIEAAFSGPDNAKVRGEAIADVRLLALRELMKLEMPDRWSDILGNGVGANLPSSSANYLNPVILAARPSIAGAYFRAFRRLDAPSTTEAEERLLRNQGAECLYLVIMQYTGDGEARTLFSRQDIGDTDGDGALEFLDGWGRPIHFIRWPAGFALRSEVMSADANNDHDPFDFFGRDHVEAHRADPDDYPGRVRPYIYQLADTWPAFRLVPLVYSSGPDGISDINSSPKWVTGLDPYAIDSDTGKYQFGIPEDDAKNPDGEENFIDNIHNHLQDNR